MRERTITVNAATPWSDTEVELRRGQEMRFRATGKVKWGPNRSDGPGGEGGNHYNAARPLPDRPAASLIGRVGDRDDVFFIGADDGSIRVRDGGRLYLGINDDFLQDNSGSFRVTVYYEAARRDSARRGGSAVLGGACGCLAPPRARFVGGASLGNASSLSPPSIEPRSRGPRRAAARPGSPAGRA